MDNLKLLFKTIYDFDNNLDIQINTITNDMIHFAFPQFDKTGNKLNKTVQVDILLTKFPEFCKFYMYSPSEFESHYKGAHRNELLRAIAYILSYEIIAKDNNNNPIIWKQNDLGSTGLYDDIKTLVDEKGERLKYKDTN